MSELMGERQDSGRESRRDGGSTKSADEMTEVDDSDNQPRRSSVIQALRGPYLPPELIRRIIKESISTRAGSLCINLSILLCCRDWYNLAQSVLWQTIHISLHRINLFIHYVAFCDSSMNVCRLRSLTIAGTSISFRILCQHISRFRNLQHLSATHVVPSRRLNEMVLDDLVSKLPLSIQSLELVLPTLGYSKTCERLCNALKVAMKKLRKLRIIVTAWVMADALARLKNLWIHDFPLLARFSLVVPLGSGRFDACDPLRQRQFLTEITNRIHQAKCNGKLSNLSLCRITAYPGGIRTMGDWRKGLWPGDRTMTFDATQNRLMTCPIVWLSEKGNLAGNGPTGLFWTRAYMDCRELRGAFRIVSHSDCGHQPMLKGKGPHCLAVTLGTIDDLMSVWESQVYTSPQQEMRAPWPTNDGSFSLSQSSEVQASKRYEGLLTMLTDQDSIKFVRKQEESLDPAKLPQLETLL